MTRTSTLLLVLSVTACGLDLRNDTATLAIVADGQRITATARFPDASHSLLGSSRLPAGDTLTACCGASCAPMTTQWGLFGDSYAADLGAATGDCTMTWTRGVSTAAAHATLPRSFDLTSAQAESEVPRTGAVSLSWTNPTGGTAAWILERSCGNTYAVTAGGDVPDTGTLTISVARLLEGAPDSGECRCSVTLTRAVAGTVDPGFGGFDGRLEARQERTISFRVR
jgi:hypothetical protein